MDRALPDAKPGSDATPQPKAASPVGGKGTALGTLPELVAFEKVTKSFGGGPNPKVALQDVSFVVEDLPDKGELVTIVGPSGCGKSTLLRIIAALEPHFPPTTGHARRR